MVRGNDVGVPAAAFAPGRGDGCINTLSLTAKSNNVARIRRMSPSGHGPEVQLTTSGACSTCKPACLLKAFSCPGASPSVKVVPSEPVTPRPKSIEPIPSSVRQSHWGFRLYPWKPVIPPSRMGINRLLQLR